ncbi:hypothetical protein Q0590_14165 [Rhodocytophaga aerolata]|uniref:DUF4760 domain-containing protein n=1 Tax=Rhodocytophaga aerolata TaxID=455078 RepID=A0ABT8R644_9BACT|nr:hypothetical protein [Rhodocytophaga aerolata]MDO1447409.1 hypothetical protein [Rhodocytophaga aerolata]
MVPNELYISGVDIRYLTLLLSFIATGFAIYIAILNYKLFKKSLRISENSHQISKDSLRISEDSHQISKGLLSINATSLDVSKKAFEITSQARITDTVLHFNNRFGSILDKEIGTENDKWSEDMFWERFWGLQQEQYVFWKWGLIPNDLYAFWLLRRNRDFESGLDKPSIVPTSYKLSFEKQKIKNRQFNDSNEFFSFFDKIHEAPRTNAESKIKEIVEKEEKRLIKDDRKKS